MRGLLVLVNGLLAVINLYSFVVTHSIVSLLACLACAAWTVHIARTEWL